MIASESNQGMLKLHHVSTNLNGFELKDIHLEIQQNEYFVILGPTGTGKTILLETIAGMHSVNQGEIWLGEANITKTPPEMRRFGFVYQDYALFPHLNVYDNIAFGLKAQGYSKKEIVHKIEEIVSWLHISPLLNRNTYTLSGGEQQRVSLARALITKPKVLLLDEPLSSLDPNTKEMLQYELKQLHKQTETLMIHVTHDFEEAMFLADRIAIMNQGKVLQIGTPEDIFYHPNTMEAANFVVTENIFESEIVIEHDKKFIRLHQHLLEIDTTLTEYIGYTIRPEHVLLSQRPLLKNAIKGKIIFIYPKGLFLKVVIDIGINLTAIIEKKNNLSLALGNEIFCNIEPANINSFPLILSSISK